MRTLMLLIALLPVSGIAVVVADDARAAWRTREVAADTRDASQDLSAIVDARLAVFQEQVASTTVVTANEIGVGIDEVSAFLGVDYRRELERARQVVDADPLLTAITSDPSEIGTLRLAIDQGTAIPEQVAPLFNQMSSAVNSSWSREISSVRLRMSAAELSESIHERVHTADDAYQALNAGAQQSLLISQILVSAPSPIDTVAMVEAAGRYGDVATRLGADTGPEVAAAWRLHLIDPGARRFDLLRERVERAVIEGTTAELTGDVTAFAERVFDAFPWLNTLVATVQAGVRDLRAESELGADAATSRLRSELGIPAALTLLAAAGSLMAARLVTRPVGRLAASAHAISEGRLVITPLATSGPRELGATTVAFNEMTATLALVEAQAISLAEDPGAAVIDEQLPGRTGRALGVALNRLRATMRLAEQRRRELEQAATHDSLTGLLNRGAALEMIARELARAQRHRGLVAVLFVDLDGLKTINDSHGHAAGDDAIVQTGEALRSVTRAGDIAARFGGDEFVVSGTVDDASEVRHLAERIRVAVAARRVVWAEGSQSLHCSIGVAVARPGEATADMLIADADTALYEAKRLGRDRVAWFQETVGTELEDGQVDQQINLEPGRDDVGHDA